MFNHIVVPLDGSKLSEAALAYAAPLAKRMAAKVILLHSTNDPHADMLGERTLARSMENARAGASEYLRSMSARLNADGVACEVRIEHGPPTEVILKYAEERKPDLIIMSTHGRSGIRRMVVGSVATAILPRVQAPVLIVHPQEEDAIPETLFENLIVPLDMSDRSGEVLPLAKELADALKLKTTLITSIPSPSKLYSGSVPEVHPYPDDLLQQTQDAIEEYLKGASSDFNEDGSLDAQWESLEGNPATKIVECAESRANPLIAMCTQGRTGLGRMVLGSVTDAVIRAGSVPVLVAPHSGKSG